MTVDELPYWVAFDRMLPIGDERNDYLFAHLCLRILQSAGARKKGGGGFTMQDLLIFKPPRQEATPREFFMQRFGHLVKEKPKETDT